MRHSARTPKPITHIELSEKHKKLRLILICVLLAIAVVAIGTGIYSMLNTQPGWQVVEASTSGISSSEDFTFQYHFSGDTATADRKKLSLLYSDAMEKSYWLFTVDQPSESFSNMYTVNHNPNTEVTVDPVLYNAFSQMAEYDSRYLYLGPVYAQYENLFYSDNDPQAQEMHPEHNPEIADYISQIIAFIRDPNAINLELLGDNRVRLSVSDAYLSFAQAHEIENFIDFNWMKNAFIADYFASILQENGYTAGFIASVDGFTRNLDSSGTPFSLNILDRVDKALYPAAVMEYKGPGSIVYLRDYPVVQEEKYHYYVWENGDITSAQIDPADGFSKSSLSNLITFSKDSGCADVLLQIAPVYLADQFDAKALNQLTSNGLYSTWCQDRTVYYNDSSLQILSLYDKEGIKYTSSLVD